jgi:hypothetical protein
VDVAVDLMRGAHRAGAPSQVEKTEEPGKPAVFCGTSPRRWPHREIRNSRTGAPFLRAALPSGM